MNAEDKRVTVDELRQYGTCDVETAGRFLGVSRRVAYDAAKRGEIPTLQLGRRLLVPVPRLLELVGLPHTDSEAGSATEPTTAQIHAVTNSTGGSQYGSDPAA